MNIAIKHLAIHQLKQIPQATVDAPSQVALVANNQLIEITPVVSTMMEQLHQLYSMKNKGFAVFSDPQQATEDNADSESQVNKPRFSALLANMIADEQDFLSFSLDCAEHLIGEINQYSFAEPGILLLSHYHHLANDYLFICLLNHTNSTTIDDALNIAETHYLDIEKSDIMARIDLTEWQHNPKSERYLTFLRGRIGRKVGDFFLDFLGAETGLDPKVQTQALIQAVDDYCAESALNRQQENTYKQDVLTYCQAQAKQGEELSVQGLSEYLSTDAEFTKTLNPEQVENKIDFAEFTLQKGYEFPEQFPADTNALKKLTKFSGSGGGLTISFTSLQLGEKINWDKTTDTLVIRGTPPNLREQLERYFSE